MLGRFLAMFYRFSPLLLPQLEEKEINISVALWDMALCCLDTSSSSSSSSSIDEVLNQHARGRNKERMVVRLADFSFFLYSFEPLCGGCLLRCVFLA